MHLTFQASGSLWQDALVMQDLESKSLWSQISGECIQGPNEGKVLTIFKASHTTYSQFKIDYPDGLLLVKPEKGQAGSYYDNYFADSAKMGIFGRVETFEKLVPKAKIFGIRVENSQSAVSLEYLETNGYAILPLASQVISIAYDKQTGTVIAFKLEGLKPAEITELVVNDFQISLPDNSTSWDMMTGKLLNGTGEHLESVPVITAFWFAWVSFFPNTELLN